jgi:hypothetical protein
MISNLIDLNPVNGPSQSQTEEECMSGSGFFLLSLRPHRRECPVRHFYSDPVHLSNGLLLYLPAVVAWGSLNSEIHLAR